MIQRKVDNLNKPVSIQEIELIITYWKKQVPGSNGVTCEFY